MTSLRLRFGCAVLLASAVAFLQQSPCGHGWAGRAHADEADLSEADGLRLSVSMAPHRAGRAGYAVGDELALTLTVTNVGSEVRKLSLDESLDVDVEYWTSGGPSGVEAYVVASIRPDRLLALGQGESISRTVRVVARRSGHVTVKCKVSNVLRTVRQRQAVGPGPVGQGPETKDVDVELPGLWRGTLRARRTEVIRSWSSGWAPGRWIAYDRLRAELMRGAGVDVGRAIEVLSDLARTDSHEGAFPIWKEACRTGRYEAIAEVARVHVLVAARKGWGTPLLPDLVATKARGASRLTREVLLEAAVLARSQAPVRVAVEDRLIEHYAEPQPAETVQRASALLEELAADEDPGIRERAQAALAR